MIYGPQSRPLMRPPMPALQSNARQNVGVFARPPMPALQSNARQNVGVFARPPMPAFQIIVSLATPLGQHHSTGSRASNTNSPGKKVGQHISVN